LKRALGRFGHYLSIAGLLILFAGWMVFLRPVSLGGDATYVVIRGSSMLPVFKSGDLVIARAAATYTVGDALAYRVPPGEIGAGTIVIHRIIGGDGEAGFTLQGDNNDAPDPWHPRLADAVGKAVLAVPDAGRVIAFLHQPVTLGGLAAGLVVMSVFARPAKSKPAPSEPGDQPVRTNSRSSSIA
jgi:signal peptidase